MHCLSLPSQVRPGTWFALRLLPALERDARSSQSWSKPPRKGQPGTVSNLPLMPGSGPPSPVPLSSPRAQLTRIWSEDT